MTEPSAIKLWAGLILDSVFDVIFIVDHELKIVDANSAVTGIGYTREALIGQPITDLTVDNAGFRVAVKELSAAAKEGDRELRRFEAIRQDKSRYWVDVSISEIETTETEDYLITFHDVDERAKARKELEEQKAKIEAVLQETDKLRKEAEASRFQLELANEQLAKRQEITEAALQEEQKFRLSSQKTGFQKTFVTYLALLIGISLLLPYLGMISFLSEKITDSTGNLSLLLIQALTGVSGFIFGRQTGKGESAGND